MTARSDFLKRSAGRFGATRYVKVVEVEPLNVHEMNELGAVLGKYLDDTKWRERTGAGARWHKDDPDGVVLRRRALCRRIIRGGLWGNG